MQRAADIQTWPAGDSSMARRMRERDWKQTPLGPVTSWPAVLRFAVQSSLDSALPTFIWWGEHRMRLHNDAACALVATGNVDIPGVAAAGFSSDAWRALEPMIAAVFATGAAVTAPIMSLAGAPATIVLSPLREDTGTIGGALGTVVPAAMTATTNSGLEERQAFALELSDALRTVTDPIEVQAIATRLLGERLQADRVYYLDIDEAQGQLLVERDFARGNAPSLVGRYELSDFPWITRTLRTGESLVIEDIGTTHQITNDERPALENIEVRAFVAVPLVRQERLVAALCVTVMDTRPWTTADVALIDVTAERTWAAVEQARAEESLRRSEEKYKKTKRHE